jgi:hypothetical protein
MDPSLLHSLGSNIARFGANLLSNQSKVAAPPSPSPSAPPKVFPDASLIEDAASSALSRLKNMGIPETEAIKAIVHQEADRRIQARMNEVYAAAWEESALLQQAKPDVSNGLFWGALGLAAGVGLTVLIVSVCRPTRPM